MNQLLKMTLKKRTSLFVPIFVILLGCLQVSLHADDELEALLEEASRLNATNRESFELPDAVGVDLGDDSLRFFLLATTPIAQVFYYLEGDEYRPIRPAYNTFGNVHRISPRSELVLCNKVTQTVGGEPQIVYRPVFKLKLGARTDLFAVFLPLVPQADDGAVYDLRAVDFSEKRFPFNQVTFMNTLPKPLAVSLEGSRGVVQPGEFLRGEYTTGRKGAGYLKVALAIRDADGSAKLLYNRRLPVFKNERTLAIPIADPWGRGGVEVLTYRDARQ